MKLQMDSSKSPRHGVSVPVNTVKDDNAGPVAEGFGARLAESEMDTFMNEFDQQCVDEFAKQVSSEKSYNRITTFAFSDICPYVTDSMKSIHQDSFTQCFQVRSRWSHLLPR